MSLITSIGGGLVANDIDKGDASKGKAPAAASGGTGLSKKFHGVPMWGIAAGGGVVLILAYKYYKSSKAASTASTAATTAATGSQGSQGSASGSGAGGSGGSGSGYGGGSRSWGGWGTGPGVDSSIPPSTTTTTVPTGSTPNPSYPTSLVAPVIPPVAPVIPPVAPPTSAPSYTSLPGQPANTTPTGSPTADITVGNQTVSVPYTGDVPDAQTLANIATTASANASNVSNGITAKAITDAQSSVASGAGQAAPQTGLQAIATNTAKTAAAPTPIVVAPAKVPAGKGVMGSGQKNFGL